MPRAKPSKGCTLPGRSQVVSKATTVWEATPCWTALSSDASLADMLPSTCWAQTGRTPLWQFSQARPEPKLSVDHFSHEPQLGGMAPGVVVACACCACVTARWPWEL